MNKVIPLFKPYLPPEERLMPRLRDVLYSGQISEGQPVYDFERQFGEFAGTPNILSFYSGTAALHAALVLAGVRSGDEVISTAMTAEPTNMAIKHAGAAIVWADVDPANGNVSPQSIRAKVTPRTRAIMVVHYGGLPAALGEIQQIAREHDIPVIEDCAHALGARYAGKPIGVTSQFAMYSLQAIKHMTTVDGGMLACRDAGVLAAGRKFRWFGIDRQASRTEVDVDVIGYKYHMNNLNATIGLVQLDHIQSIVDAHIKNGKLLTRILAGLPGLELCQWEPVAEPSFWFFTVLAERRDDLARYLTENGIGNSMCHKRNDWHSVFASSRCDLPGLDSFYSRMLHIPCGWWLQEEDLDFFAATIRRGW